MSGAGRKQGVSLWRNCVATPLRCSINSRKRWYPWGVQSRLNRCRSEGIKEKSSAAHDLPAVDPDIELPPHHVDMSGGVPIGAGMRAVGIAEGDVDSRDLLVLQNIADHVVHADVGADGELAHAVAEFVGVAVVPEFALQRVVRAVGLAQTAVFHPDGQRGGAQVAVLF